MFGVQLRDFQERAVSEIRRILRETDHHPLVVAPTGSGKTVMATHGIIHPAIERGFTVLFLVHLREVVTQTAATLGSLHHTILMQGHKFDPSARCVVSTIQSACSSSMSKKLRSPEIIIIDEAHRSSAPDYQRVTKRFPNARIIGFTATPIRLDGTTLNPPGGPFTAMIEAAQIPDLVQRRLLVPDRSYSYDTILPTARRRGELDTKATDACTAPVVNAVLESFRRHNPSELRTIAFGINRAHAKFMCAAFQAAGINAAYLDGETRLDIRDELLKQFRAGRIRVLWNVDVLSTGYDNPMIGCVLNLRPTDSLTQYIQQGGRGLRIIDDRAAAWCIRNSILPPEKKHLIYIDHGGNVLRHGTLTERRRWTFDVSPKEIQKDGPKYASRYRVCEDCRLVHRANDHQVVCIECGTPLPGFSTAPVDPPPNAPKIPPGRLPGGLQSLWTPAQAAQYLGVTDNALKSWRMKRIGPPWVKISVSGAVRYRPADVIAYARSRTWET